MEKGHLDPWFGFFKTVLDMPTPPELAEPVDNTEEIQRRDKHIFWKIKAITAKITYRAFVKYSKPKEVEQLTHITEFSKQFRENFSLPLLESHLQLLLNKRTQFIGSKALAFAIKFLGYATK